MATLRDQALAALTGPRVPAALTGFGAALGIPAAQAAGAALSLAGAVDRPRARTPRDEDPFAGVDLGPEPADADPFAGVDLGDTADEDPFSGVDLGETTATDEPAEPVLVPNTGTDTEPVSLPGEESPVSDVDAPGGTTVMRWRPWEKVAGAGVGIVQSVGDLALAAMSRGEKKSAAADAMGRIKQAAADAKAASKGVIEQRDEQSFTSNLLDDLYDVTTAIPRIGLSALSEEPADVDQFDKARKAGYQVLPGAGGQVGALLDDPLRYARSMPVSAAIDLTPIGRAIGRVAKLPLTRSLGNASATTAAARTDRLRYDMSQEIAPRLSELPEANRAARAANTEVNAAFRTLDEATDELTQANQQLEEIGPYGGAYDVEVAQAKVDAAQAAVDAATANRRRASQALVDLEDEIERLKAGAQAYASTIMEDRRTAPHSPIVRAIGKLVGPERLAAARRTLTQPSAQSRPVFELAAEEALRPADVVPSSVVKRADVRRGQLVGQARQILDRAANDKLTAQDIGILNSNPAFRKTGQLPTEQELVRQLQSTVDELDPLERDYREIAGEVSIPALTQQMPSGREIPTPPELRSIVKSDVIDPGMAASLMPLVEPPLPKNWLVQVQDIVKGNLTTGSPSSILNNAGSGVLEQVFRRGPVGAALAIPRAIVHTTNMLRPGALPPAIRNRLSQYDRTYQILQDLKVLDRDALTVDANRSGMSKWADTLSKVGTLGDTLPTAYQLGDKMLKLEETVHNLDKYRGYIDSLKPGQFVEFRMTPRHTLRVDMERVGGQDVLVGRVFGAGNLQASETIRKFSTNLDNISPELVRAAAQTGLDAFFDYTDVPNFLKNMRSAPVIGIASPFTTWAYKAMDLPGKRGLGREMLLGPDGVKTNSPAIAARQAAGIFAQGVGRIVILDAAHRQLLQDDRGESRKIAQAFSYFPKEPKIQLLRAMTDPRTGQATEYGYLAQGGNYNFLGPTDRAIRLAVWGVGNLFDSPEQLRDLGRIVQDSDAPAKEKKEAVRQLELLYRINSGQVSDFSDVADVFGLGGSTITQVWEKLVGDERMGNDVSTSDIGTDILKSAGVPGLAVKMAANSMPDVEWLKPFRERGRDLVQPDENLRQELVRPMIKNLLGLSFKLVPLENAFNPDQKKVKGDIDRYLGKVSQELEKQTDTKQWRIDELNAEADALESKGNIEESERRRDKAKAREELRVILFGKPASKGMPAIQGEFDAMRENLFDTINRLTDVPAKPRKGTP